MRERERDLNGRVPSYSTTEMKVSTACAVNYRRRRCLCECFLVGPVCAYLVAMFVYNGFWWVCGVEEE